MNFASMNFASMNFRACVFSIVVAVGATLPLSGSASADVLKVTPGSWESVVTLNSNILGSRTQTDTECLTESEIDPRKMLEGMPTTECDFQSTVSGNGSVMNFTIKCNTEAGPLAGAGRFEGANLIAQNVDVYHRGSNDMIVNPQQVLSGELLGTGDLISLNQPLTIEVEVLYTGQLIFYYRLLKF